jgi:hypothetical protein
MFYGIAVLLALVFLVGPVIAGIAWFINLVFIETKDDEALDVLTQWFFLDFNNMGNRKKLKEQQRH